MTVTVHLPCIAFVVVGIVSDEIGWQTEDQTLAQSHALTDANDANAYANNSFATRFRRKTEMAVQNLLASRRNAIAKRPRFV